jgi:hypothetical protein
LLLNIRFAIFSADFEKKMDEPFGPYSDKPIVATVLKGPNPDRQGRSLLDSLTSEEFGHARIKWLRIYKNAKRMFFHPSYTPNLVSPHVPFTFEEYVKHLNQWKFLLRGSKAKREARRARETIKNFQFAIGFDTFYRPDIPSNLSFVLCRSTIWCTDPYVNWAHIADWPVQGELELEGDARIKTENHIYGRFLPLPRLPQGHPLYDPDYTRCPVITILEFDKTWPPPGHESILGPVDQIPPEMIPKLLNSDLLKELDDGLYP